MPDARLQGLGPFLAACLMGGLFSLITPCVFPMIPVTLSYFSKKQGAGGLGRAGAYALGIISTFAILGVLAAVLFGAASISNFAANPYVNFALGVLFVALALNLFGLFEVSLPGALTNKVASASRTAGVAAPFLMGVTFSLTSFTCTMPIVGALLATAAKGDVLYPTLGMATYGSAFSLPFFLLALFPGAMAKRPNSGAWLATVKPCLGFIELAAALKFFSNADLGWGAGWLTRPVFLALWALVLGLLGGYLLGLPDSIKQRGWTRRMLGVAAFVPCGFLLAAMNGRSLGEFSAFLPPDPYPSLHASKAAGSMIVSSFADALQKAKETGRPIFVDFTGVTCTNCRWMEQNILTQPRVSDALGSFVRVQLYTDRPTPDDRSNQALQGRLAHNQALPTYVLVNPDGSVIDKFEGATRDAEGFIGFINKGEIKKS